MKKLNVLQSWRTIFILMICLEHMALNNILNIFASGGEGVTFFIVLSGFLSSYVYYNRSINFSVSDQKKFIISKIKKFYPLHVCALLLSLLLSILVVIKNAGIDIEKIAILIGKTILNATFLQVYIPINGVFMNEINGVAWFLSTIIFCYSNTLFAINVLKKCKSKWILLGACIIVHMVIVTLFKDSQYSSFIIYVFPPFRFIEYFCGMILGDIFIHKQYEIGGIKANLFETIAIVCFIGNHILIKNSFWSNNSIPQFCVAMILIMAFAYESGIFSRLLNNKLLVYIGNISFDIYIMHQVIIKYITTIFGWTNLAALISGVVIFLFAIMKDKYYEDLKNKVCKLILK